LELTMTAIALVEPALHKWRPDSSTTFWDLQELSLLRSEAEALLGDGEPPSEKTGPEALTALEACFILYYYR
jgi:hypothetical protein